MIDEQQAKELMITLIELRNKANETKELRDIKKFEKHEQLCIEKFKYVVDIKTSRYRAFSNYDDLNQEGFEAMLKAMKNYNPNKGSIFWWLHKYIDTRISRSANLHTTIRFPMKIAKENSPKREFEMPLQIDNLHCPDKEFEIIELNAMVQTAINDLDFDQQKDVVNMYFGFTEKNPLSISKICKKMKISRPTCIRLLQEALEDLKQNIEL